MTDDSNQTQQQPSDSAAAGKPAAKDPLAELEALLAETKAAKVADGTAPTEPLPNSEELARQQQAAAEKNEQQVQLHRAKMEGIKDTPQYQAGAAARAQEDAEDEQLKTAHDGHQIAQITTTKIDE